MELYIGFAGLVCSLFYRIPQIYKIFVTKSAGDISTWMIHIQNCSYVLYIVYGYFISDIVYIISSIVSIIQNIIILGAYFKYSINAKNENLNSILIDSNAKSNSSN